MYTNAKIIIYLLKVDNENPGTKFVICLKLTKKDTGTTSLTMKTSRNINVALVSLLLILKRFLTFYQNFILEFWEVLLAGFTSSDQSTDKLKLQNIDREMQIVQY